MTTRIFSSLVILTRTRWGNDVIRSLHMLMVFGLIGELGLLSTAHGESKSMKAPSAAEPLVLPIGVIKCPEEVTKKGDVGFGAYLTTHAFNEVAAKTLGFEADAGRRLLVVSAPLAEVKNHEQAGCVAIIDPDSSRCLKVLTAPFPMEVFNQGQKKEQFDGMQFGSNFCFSPEGGFLFVGCKAGGKGFVLNLADGAWIEITHPLMQVCAATDKGIVPDNAGHLNYGTKACFANEHTLYLVSNTATFKGRDYNVVPGVLMFKVIFDPTKGVTYMDDPFPRKITSAEEAKEKADPHVRGAFVNRATYRSNIGYRRDPALDFHNGRLASNGFAVGHGTAVDACSADRYDFYACNENELGTPPTQKGVPFIERCEPRPGPRADGIAVRSDRNDASYATRERFLPFDDVERGGSKMPGEWSLWDIGVVDRTKNIGWTSGSSISPRGGCFGLFRWNDDMSPVFRPIRITLDGQSEPSWGHAYKHSLPMDLDALRPWTIRHIDPIDGRLYVGVTGAKPKTSRNIDPGHVYIFDLSLQLKDLGWSMGSVSPRQVILADSAKHPPANTGLRTYVTVPDINGRQIEARLLSETSGTNANLKVERRDGRMFEIPATLLPAASLEALRTATLKDRQPAAPLTGTAAATLQKLNQIAPGPVDGANVTLQAKNMRGQNLSLDQFKGKVVLVDFWASWCPPCLAELPELQRVYQDYNARGFEVVGISLDTDRAALKRFIEDRKIPWQQCLDTKGETSLTKQFGVTGIPSTFLINRDGTLFQRNAYPDRLPALLEKLLPALKQ